MSNYTIQTPEQLKPILAGFRKSAGLTQADMAMRLGITQQTYSAAERNASNMSVSKLMSVLNALTPFYDVLSAYPVLGEGVNQISAQKVRMAMAVRGKNPHWKMQEIQPRHWHALAKRHGMNSVGKDSPFVQIIEQTTAVIKKVRGLLPSGFPEHVSESILNGLTVAAKRYENTASITT